MRHRFRAFAFPLPPDVRSIPLLYKHRAEVVAGTVDHLEYSHDGSLFIRATVTHELARRCQAFSVGASILDYEIVNPDSTDFYGLIKAARIDEVSCTDVPANPHALVTRRMDASARARLCEQAQQHVKLFGRLVGELQAIQEANR
jgi:hypothetical protein